MSLESSKNEIPVEYKKIDFGNAENIELFKEFSILLFKEFPDENEQLYIEILLRQVADNSKFIRSEYICVLAMRDEK
jgi:hypothetical protein